MTQPDETVVRVISERDPNCVEFDGKTAYQKRKLSHSMSGFVPINYFGSIDALRPVLAKLTPSERWTLAAILDREVADRTKDSYEWTFALLTLDPPVLARAVAKAILACREKGVG